MFYQRQGVELAGSYCFSGLIRLLVFPTKPCFRQPLLNKGSCVRTRYQTLGIISLNYYLIYCSRFPDFHTFIQNTKLHKTVEEALKKVIESEGNTNNLITLVTQSFKCKSTPNRCRSFFFQFNRLSSKIYSFVRKILLRSCQ